MKWRSTLLLSNGDDQNMRWDCQLGRRELVKCHKIGKIFITISETFRIELFSKSF